jgi:hypothetical protein
MSATGCRKICRGAFLAAASLALFVVCGPTTLNADPLAPGAAEDAFYNLACAKLAGTLAGDTEEAHRAEIPGWVRLCSAHPRRSECIETAVIIRNYKASPLKCGQDIKQDIKNGSDIAASFLPSFDRVCADVTVAWLSNTESEHRTEVAGWTRTCNAHPDVSVCKGAAGLIDEKRKVQPLNCGSNADESIR